MEKDYRAEGRPLLPLAESCPGPTLHHLSQLVQLEIPDKPQFWSELVWQLWGNVSG